MNFERRDFEIDSDVEWLAFGYLLDELDADLRAAFELRLADDDVAQQALVSAVKISSDVVVSFSQDSSSGDQTPVLPVSLPMQTDESLHENRSALSVAVGVFSVVAAVMLLVTVGYFLFGDRESDGLGNTTVLEQQLAENWASVLETASFEMDSHSLEDDESLNSDFWSSESWNSEPPAEDPDNTESESWLYVAVQASGQEQVDELNELESDDF